MPTGGRPSHFFTRDQVKAIHAKYWQGESPIALGAALNPPIGPTAIYYWFDRFELPRRCTYTKRVRSAATPVRDAIRPERVIVEAPKQPRVMSGPPIYRSEFIRGDAVKRLVAGR